MHRSHALFGYKRPGLILLAIPSVPAADIATAFLRGLICSGVSRRVSPCYGHSSPGPMQSPVHSRPPPGLFIHPPQHLVPGGQHGREPRDRGSCKRIRVKTQGFRQPYTSSNVSASCPGVICRKSLYPRWDRSGSGWGRSLHSSCRTDRHCRRRAAGCRSPRNWRESNRSCGRPESPG